MQEYSISFFYLAFTGLILLQSCQSDQGPKLQEVNPTINSNIIRFENELLDAQSNDISTHLQNLKKRYPAFTKIFLYNLMSFPENDSIISSELTQILVDTGFLKLAVDVKKEFFDFTKTENEINQAIENYLALTQKDITPNVYTFISGFVYQCFLFEDENRDGIGIGLDMFLGSDFPYEQINPSNPAFSSYLTRAYNSDHIAKKVAEVLAEDLLPPPSKSDFLSLMIWGGKKLYIMDQIIAFKEDHIVMEYTPEQLLWCQNNESQIWDFFFDKNLFYETDFRKYSKLVAPAPTTPGMPTQSPGQIANYMGWQIVKAFVQKTSNSSLDELINTNPQDILDQSRFKPNRSL